MIGKVAGDQIETEMFALDRVAELLEDFRLEAGVGHMVAYPFDRWGASGAFTWAIKILAGRAVDHPNVVTAEVPKRVVDFIMVTAAADNGDIAFVALNQIFGQRKVVSAYVTTFNQIDQC